MLLVLEFIGHLGDARELRIFVGICLLLVLADEVSDFATKGQGILLDEEGSVLPEFLIFCVCLSDKVHFCFDYSVRILMNRNNTDYN